MLVSVIIINYNTFQLTCNCITSIIEYTKGVEYEIILVDNNSTECDAGLFAQKFPSIRLVKSNENSGFAKGNNLGIANAKGDTILLLNSDTYLQEDSVSRAALILQQQNNIGVIGVRMVYPGGGIQHTARKFRSIKWELFDLLRFIPLLMPYKKRAALMLGKYFKVEFSTTCDWLNGAFFMFPKTMLQRLPGGKLDDRFFMYGEDQLWCYQIKKLGYSNFFFHETTIIHINSGSTNKNKQLQLRKVMIKHEVEIMREQRGAGLYFFTLRTIYLTKEYSRYYIKWLALKLLGKTIK